MSSESEQELEKLRSEPSSSGTESFHSQYVVLNTIGQGGFARVKLARHRLTGKLVAVKIIRKRQHWCHPETSEVDILKMTNHPNIISLFQVIENKKTIYLIMELAEGKPLYQHIEEAGHLKEDEARIIFKQILSAMSYCHDRGIIHRDLKPGNIMIDNSGRIKIIDFGLGTQVMPGQKLRYHCGTYAFSAPEVILGRLYEGPKIDTWSLGILLYCMITGRLPFDGTNTTQLKRQVTSGKYSIPRGLSIELQDLISYMLTQNPKHRPTITEFMLHPWLKEDSASFPEPCGKQIQLRPDMAIIKAMEHIGFEARDIEESLFYRKYNQAMASYYFLKEQALQECDSPIRAQPVNPWKTPYPSLDDPATFCSGLRRRSEPILFSAFSNSQTSTQGQKAKKREERRVSWPGVLPCRPLQTTPTMGQAHIHFGSVPCLYSMGLGGESSSISASAEHKPLPSRGRSLGFKGWVRRIANGLRKLCCCLPARKQRGLGEKRASRRLLREKRVSPQM
ncbi:sperm motility kinase 2B-like [Grammomys surdaster]|uniref:sperm motility kinase 2B-like n=1 Tax=Grammomys surdaster TaxID=491861 RepID=UPI0010A0C002|nr:sperm motility kinase 2B-like [Grammomys surdaster]